MELGAAGVSQGMQSNAADAASFAAAHVTDVDATTSQVSCCRPEVRYFASDGPDDGSTGVSRCTPGEGDHRGEHRRVRASPTPAGSNPGYPAGSAMLARDHPESGIRVDPTNPGHLIGSVKWFVSAEGYNHLLGFYESFNGGKTWTVAGASPVMKAGPTTPTRSARLTGFGNDYAFILPYQFFCNPDGSPPLQHRHAAGAEPGTAGPGDGDGGPPARRPRRRTGSPPAPAIPTSWPPTTAWGTNRISSG